LIINILGERLIGERGQALINVNLQDANLKNDVALINVALFWNHEIGEMGQGRLKSSTQDQLTLY
jgi:hypothetical protein